VYAYGNGGPAAPPSPVRLGGESGEYAEKCLFGFCVCHTIVDDTNEWKVGLGLTSEIAAQLGWEYGI